MSQAEGPEAQVGSCVGDASQTVLYGVDGLVNSYVTKVKLWWKDKMFSAHSMVIVTYVFLLFCFLLLIIFVVFLVVFFTSTGIGHVKFYLEYKGMQCI